MPSFYLVAAGWAPDKVGTTLIYPAVYRARLHSKVSDGAIALALHNGHLLLQALNLHLLGIPYPALQMKLLTELSSLLAGAVERVGGGGGGEGRKAGRDGEVCVCVEGRGFAGQ